MFRRLRFPSSSAHCCGCYLQQQKRFASSAFCIVGSTTKELSPEDVKRLYSRPENCRSSITTATNSQETSSFESTGPILDLSVIGVVKNTQLGPTDDQLPLLKCDIVSSWISPARGAVSDFIVDKQVFRVQVRGRKYFSSPSCSSPTNLFQENAIMFCHGRLILKPVFDSNNFKYQYFPELILSDEYGWAECLMHEKVTKKN